MNDTIIKLIPLLGVALLGCSGADDAAEFDDAPTGEAAGVKSAELPSEVTAVPPDFELTSPTGSWLMFFAGEDGSVDVVEVGNAGAGSVLEAPELRDANAFEIFHAVADEHTEVPVELLAGVVNPKTVWATLAQPQGWLRPSAARQLAAAPSECSSHAAFLASYCVGRYNCALDQTSSRTFGVAPVLSYRGGICNHAGSTYVELVWRSRPNGQCGATGPWNLIASLTLGAGGWVKHVNPNTAPGREYVIHKGQGGNADIGHRYTRGDCVL